MRSVGAPAVTVRVLVADDHAVVREGIRHVLQADPDFTVVGEAANGAEVVALARTLQPDVIVLDISMPDGSGFTVIPALNEAAARARVLILSIHDHEQYVLESVRAGAQGYLRKDSSPAELRAAVRALHDGLSFFSANVAAQLAAAVRTEAAQTAQASKLELLTPRERNVLAGIVRGRTNKEIAAELEISPRTVESHRESLMRKLEIRTVAGLTKFAVEQGLMPE